MADTPSTKSSVIKTVGDFIKSNKKALAIGGGTGLVVGGTLGTVITAAVKNKKAKK